MTTLPAPVKTVDMSVFSNPFTSNAYVHQMHRCRRLGLPYVVMPIGLEYLCSLTSESEARPFDVIKNSDNVVSIGALNTDMSRKKREELRITTQELEQAEQEKQSEENKQRIAYLKLKIMRLESECDAYAKKDNTQRSYVGFSNEALLRNYMLNAIMD